MRDLVYTIGHSNRSISEFVSLLLQAGVTAVADVRSHPYSRANAHFDREAVARTLRDAQIKYVFLGDELGGRTTARDCYRNGKVQYERVALSEPFQQGLARIKRGLQKMYCIALMCAEKDPLLCHRAILVGRHLVGAGVHVRHIIDNHKIEDHDAMVLRLVNSLRISELYKDSPPSEMARIAYEVQGETIAFEPKPESVRVPGKLPLT